MKYNHNIPMKKWKEFYKNYTNNVRVYVTIFEEEYEPKINTYLWSNNFVLNPAWIVLDIHEYLH